MNNRLISIGPEQRKTIAHARFWKNYLHQAAKADLVGEAAKLSFFVNLASVPFLLIVFTVMSFLPTAGMDKVLVDTLARLVPKSAVPILREHMVHTLTMHAGFTVWVSAIGSLVIAARAVSVFEGNINEARGSIDERSFFRRWSERVFIAGLVGLCMSLAPMVLLSGWRITEFLASALGIHSYAIPTWQFFRYGLVLLLVSFTVSVLYCLGTANDRPWRWITPGTLFATVGWLVGSLAFKFLLKHFQTYNVIYGSLGSIFSAMGWIYMSCLFFLSGAHLDGLVDRSISTVYSADLDA